jgi:hypothetical protein
MHRYEIEDTEALGYATVEATCIEHAQEIYIDMCESLGRVFGTLTIRRID